MFFGADFLAQKVGRPENHFLFKREQIGLRTFEKIKDATRNCYAEICG